jgi:hypothetical protein
MPNVPPTSQNLPAQHDRERHHILKALTGQVAWRGVIPILSVTERAVHGASMSLAPRLWLNIPNSLARSRRGGLKAALPGADNSRMYCLANDVHFRVGRIPGIGFHRDMTGRRAAFTLIELLVVVAEVTCMIGLGKIIATAAMQPSSMAM